MRPLMPPASLINLTKKLIACDCCGNSGSPEKPIWSDRALRLATGNTTLIDVAVRPRVLGATWENSSVVLVDAAAVVAVVVGGAATLLLDLPPPPPAAATMITTTSAITTTPTNACCTTGRRRNLRHPRRTVAPTLLPAIQIPPVSRPAKDRSAGHDHLGGHQLVHLAGRVPELAQHLPVVLPQRR